jgi:hypothetical protein
MKASRSATTVIALVLCMLFAATGRANAAPHETAAADPIDWSQLRQACLAHPTEAATQDGWSPGRFEQCHHQDLLKVNLRKVSGEYLGFIQYEFWLLARADYSSRRVDIQLSLENVGIASQLNAVLGYITINVDNCASAAFITCTGETHRSDTIESWFNRGALDPILATSANGVGALPYSTVDLTALTSITVEYRDGQTVPWSSPLATTAARFDSAGSPIGSAPANGTVFRNVAPTMDIDRSATSAYRSEAIHVDDALHRPQRTFPSIVGKNVPGENRPLHRLMGDGANANRDEARKVCVDVWGPNYANGGLQCDEYPFRATYEGAAYSTSGVTCDNPTATGPADWRKWNGSARPIDGAENGAGGSALSAFYRVNRMLDCDAFYVRVVS